MPIFGTALYSWRRERRVVLSCLVEKAVGSRVDEAVVMSKELYTKARG